MPSTPRPTSTAARIKAMITTAAITTKLRGNRSIALSCPPRKTPTHRLSNRFVLPSSIPWLPVGTNRASSPNHRSIPLHAPSAHRRWSNLVLFELLSPSLLSLCFRQYRLSKESLCVGDLTLRDRVCCFRVTGPSNRARSCVEHTTEKRFTYDPIIGDQVGNFLMRTCFTSNCQHSDLSFFWGCGSELAAPPSANRAAPLDLRTGDRIGNTEANPSTPFLRHAPDGRSVCRLDRRSRHAVAARKAFRLAAGTWRATGRRRRCATLSRLVDDDGKTWSPRATAE